MKKKKLIPYTAFAVLLVTAFATNAMTGAGSSKIVTETETLLVQARAE
jgi:hypothetical protein